MRDSRRKKKKKRTLTLTNFLPREWIMNLLQNFVLERNKFSRFEVMGDYDSASSHCSGDTHEWHAHARTGRGVTSMATHNGHVAESNHLASLRVSLYFLFFFFLSSFFRFLFFSFSFFSTSLIQDVNSLEIHQSRASLCFSRHQKRYLPKCLEWMRVFETICNSTSIGNSHDDVLIMFDKSTCVCICICVCACVCVCVLDFV